MRPSVSPPREWRGSTDFRQDTPSPTPIYHACQPRLWLLTTTRFCRIVPCKIRSAYDLGLTNKFISLQTEEFHFRSNCPGVCWYTKLTCIFSCYYIHIWIECIQFWTYCIINENIWHWLQDYNEMPKLFF